MMSSAWTSTCLADSLPVHISAEPYHPSSSPASSPSSDSVWSAGSASSQSSQSSVGSAHADSWCSTVKALPTSIPSWQHPRRTSISQTSRGPPGLYRQSEKKVQFVDNLVDCATHMVEVIWPLSVPACHREAGQGHGVLPLRTFIQETLRRSKTSFSTLQVALYYLLLIKAYVPKYDFTMEQPEDSAYLRALQCGRRMFLAALILASKYLQDRNYSARAWSKISGLKVNEINTNEMAFLDKVDWKLHVPDAIFQRWSDVLVRYASPAHSLLWKDAVRALTPELDDVPRMAPNFAGRSPFSHGSHIPAVSRQSSMESTGSQSTLPSLGQLSVLEPMLPPSSFAPRPRMLPTPSLTPQTSVYNTPAASLANFKQSAMCSAMSLAQNCSMARSAVDALPCKPFGLEAYRTSRRSSLADVSSSSSSSPERPDTPCSMISDNSSQFSRSSSISSASSKSPTSSRDLARLAAFNSGGLTMPKSSAYYDSEQVTILGSGPLTAEPLSSPDLERLYVVEEVESHPLGPVDVYVPSSSQCYELDSHRNARKRGRSSVDLALQQQVRNLLVMPTPARSQAEIVYPYSSWSPKALQSPGRSSPERLPVQNSFNRKRFCFDAESTNLTRPEGGPGMWKDIL